MQIKPGDRLPLMLFWQTTQPLDIEDNVFVQIIDLSSRAMIAQRDAEPGCTTYSIDDWRSGDLNLDPYTLTIAPDAAPGLYTVLVGLSVAETGQRYLIFAADGTPLGDSVSLTTIEVVTP
jgi:hypothetical protein